MRKYTLDWYLSVRRPAPTKEIAEWGTKKVMRNYFVYTLGGKKKVGYCTACDQDIAPEKAQKKRFLTCPKCGEKIQAQEHKEWKSYEHVLVGHLQRYEEFFLHRIFRIGRVLNNRKADVRIEEVQMQVLAFPLKGYPSGFISGFSRETSYKNDNPFTRYGSFYNGKVVELWERGSMGGFAYNIFQVVHHTYPYNLKEEFKGTRWEHSSLWELAEAREHFNLRKALIEFVRTPQIEYVIKLKLYKIAASLIRRDLMYDNSNNIIKFLRLKSSAELQYVIDNDMTGADLEIYRHLLKNKQPITEASFKLFRNMRGIWDRLDKILEIMSAQAFYEYYLAQKNLNAKLSYKNFLCDYLDHINVVKSLELDIKDTMYSKPKNFYTVHTNLSEELSARRNKEKYERVAKALRTEKSYAFSNKDFALIVPKTANEIVHEGKVQNHCVGTYLDRVADKRSIIVFIRKVEDLQTPFYTMEINPESMSVVQCRGFKNCDQTPEVREFVSLYRKTVLAKKLKRRRKAA